MSTYLTDDDLSDLPDLDVLFPPKPLMATSANTGLRRSPRKKMANQLQSPEKRALPEFEGPQKRDRSAGTRQAKKAGTLDRVATSKNANSSLEDIPLLPRSRTVSEMLLTSNNRRSPTSPQRSLRLAHLDSTIVHLKTTAVERYDAEPAAPAKAKKQSVKRGKKSLVVPEPRTSSQTTSRTRQNQIPHYTSRFVLREARCNDDEENSNDEDEDEDTDLSGFIVADDAELSFYNTSAMESEDESDDQRTPPTRVPQRVPRRRLHRGSPTRRRLTFGNDSEGEDSDKENRAADVLVNALQNVSLEDKKSTEKKEEVETIDLTSSPAVSPEFKLNPRPSLPSTQTQKVKEEKNPSLNSNPFKDFDAILKLAPPWSKPALMIPSGELLSKKAIEPDDTADEQGPRNEPDFRFRTPPATPSRSPSKLKSPSKLLSPSKRQAIPQSPHRQSMDAFWDHNVINEWNDEFSPKKAPAASPGKRGAGRFQIWSDSDDTLDSFDSLPSPCSSPRKSGSPVKSPEKEEKKRIAEEKRVAVAQKKAFDAKKEQLALSLLCELDEHVANGQLETLSSTTGGVKIIWSKTLRSTAGRANWKRTVTKLSGSPIKGNPDSSDVGVKVQHFASIELAEKIIDCEDRLVNTLAHEFCHLTNFMISNVRDQPHGASFKKWAQKATSHLRSTSVDSWRKVEVTTKHSYTINHKYLWVCTGRPRTSAMDFLKLEDDEGCGAEYGRHSKSIDVEKHRCGKCKGFLVQVRPKPRGTASPKKKGAARVKREGSTESESGSSSGSQTNPLRTMIETIELSD
ncbi:putative SprT family metallopeptidase [Cladophialophora carrionii]|uniref:Putative SprT family metallopeptidase n=1 Tax=Cladophialophora carrionii TaxID=86049 RepID=A0A1C1CFW9_9EURO|nr:putative SprT family metallopeptidase [Cladophialophora carrionii]